MTDSKPGPAVRPEQALSRWDTEGGAGPLGPQDSSIPDEAMAATPHVTRAEFARLHARVVALEKLVGALLAGDGRTVLSSGYLPAISRE